MSSLTAVSHELHAANSPAESACPTCGATVTGKFCSACGEKRLDHHDLSVAHFAGHATHEVLHLDSKIFRTIWLLFAKPGLLTREYFAGRRNPYVAPLRLYLTVFALSLGLYSLQGLNIYDVGKFKEVDKSGMFASSIHRVATQRGETDAAAVEGINHGWQHWISILQFVNVVLLAFALQVIYVGSKRYFVEHLLFSLHVQSFALAFAIVQWPAWKISGFSYSHINAPLMLAISLVTATYVVLAVRTYYAQGVVRTIVKGLLAYGLMYAASALVQYTALLIAFIRASKHG